MKSSESPILKIALAFIAAMALILVALINRSTSTIPIKSTQTAELLHTSIALTTQVFASSFGITPTVSFPAPTTFTATNPSDQAGNQPKNGFPITVRKLEPKDLGTNIPSIWMENGIALADMETPGRITFSGFVRVGQEYLLSLYWCTTSAKALKQNMENIKSSFSVNGEPVPEHSIFTYDHNPDNVKCRYAVVALSGWVANETYKLEAQRNILIRISDGIKSYPAGVYIREVNVTAR